mgnify:CR=1 FL=1
MKTSPALQASRLKHHARRKRVNALALTLSLAAMAFGLFWLIWILVETVRLGMGGLGLSVFTESTPPPQAEIGGLANVVNDDVHALQVGGAANVVGGSFKGLQVGLVNVVSVQMKNSWQIGFWNHCSDMEHGGQVGVFNYARDVSSGLQIGLINIIRNNEFPCVPILNYHF